ncbi:MAG: thioredoxin [Patescibacteria group bacterium]
MSDQNQNAQGAVHLNDENFQKTLDESTTPVMVDFFAEWCGPCKMAGPVIDSLAKEYQGKVLIAKVDVDTSGQTAMQYRVMSIPTVLVFKKVDGEMKVVNSQIGFPGEDGYRRMIEAALNE